MTTTKPIPSLRLYEDEAESLFKSDLFPDRGTLLPGEGRSVSARERIRIMWGQDMLRDIIDGRCRTVVCGVNDSGNSRHRRHLVELITAGRWSGRRVSIYARMFQEAVGNHRNRGCKPASRHRNLSASRPV
ncbi:hypothetical protein PHYC_02573 [Phycisphaerales bacterium]|nr:hypothetical protein PHYC_02573 [Phycisphaerales bacterium]